MIYDCIVVGAGPAGSVCSFLLQKEGLHCLVLEKKAELGEKICGGFLPNRCRELIASCGIEIDDFARNAVKIAKCVELHGNKKRIYTYKENQFGIGTDRNSLDAFLLSQSIKMGTHVIFDSEVIDFKRKDCWYEIYVCKERSFQARHLVWAAGASPNQSLACFQKEKVIRKMKQQTVGISEIIKAEETSLNKDAVYFWYTGLENDYFWAIPIGNKTWNIGYWSQNDQRNIRKNFFEGRAAHITQTCHGITTLRPPRGALLGNQDFSDCFCEPLVLCCGDAAGANNVHTGEGIAQAVCSSMETAKKILG